MCGRYTIQVDMVELHRRFKVVLDDIYNKNYNCAPTENLPVITNKDQEKINYYKWGLVPYWAKEAKIGYKMINARSETILEKKSFSVPLERKRCLVLADGFYEWKKLDKKNKQPYRILLKSRTPFAFAGLWERNKLLGLNTFCIITTEANQLVSNLHDRMPVILKEEDERLWLDKDLDPLQALDLLKPYPTELMEAYPVSKAVGNADNKSPDLIKEDYGSSKT